LISLGLRLSSISNHICHRSFRSISGLKFAGGERSLLQNHRRTIPACRRHLFKISAAAPRLNLLVAPPRLNLLVAPPRINLLVVVTCLTFRKRSKIRPPPAGIVASLQKL